MGRRYLGYNKKLQKAKDSLAVHNTNKQAVNRRSGCRVILLDSALELQVKPMCTYDNPKIDFPEVPKRQGNRTVFELNDHVSLIKTNKKPKVNFVNFIDCSKIKTEKNNTDAVNVKHDIEQSKVKQEYSEESSSESNKNTNNSLVIVQDRILTKSVINLIPGTIKKVPFVPIKPKITLDQINLKRELQSHKIQLKTQAIPAHSVSSIGSGKISNVVNEQQLLNKKIHLQRVIKLHPLNLNTFKSSRKNKKHQLSSILKTVIKNNLTIELQQSRSKEVFPVALKSIDHEDIKLLDLNRTYESSEQILGI